MHTSNEHEHRLVPTDAERFLALHRLTSLRRSGEITAETCEVNHTRVLRSVINESTRRGLANLVAAEDLADAIAQALQYEHLRGAFNAGAWGKKLVKGRFYKLHALLMKWLNSAEFCKTPNQSQLRKLFSYPHLPATDIFSKIEDKEPNPSFTTYLNPIGSDDWTFSSSALLPSVLTSELVCSPLKDMYLLMQHVVNVSAGPNYLVNYTETTGHTGDKDHPYGILSHVLKDKFADYKQLISQSKPWWELFRMFKMTTLPGQKLSIPKVFLVVDKEKEKMLLNSIREKRKRDDKATEVELHSSAPARRPRQRSSSLEFEPDDQIAVSSSCLMDRETPRPKRTCTQVETLPTSASSDLNSGQTSLNAPSTAAQVDVEPQDNIREVVKQQLEDLTNAVDSMSPGEAASLKGLLEQLLQLKEQPYANRALEIISNKAPNYVGRAKHAHEVSSAMDD
ncbi:hypothetical protein RhiJN_27226 [Ceratobasidium sp. AG-Ba]|nr:hypothetical protein RhiJN_27226 [Ceratobasidium sp. AG-Ba]